jgi:hypothetical protein
MRPSQENAALAFCVDLTPVLSSTSDLGWQYQPERTRVGFLPCEPSATALRLIPLSNVDKATGSLMPVANS